MVDITGYGDPGVPTHCFVIMIACVFMGGWEVVEGVCQNGRGCMLGIVYIFLSHYASHYEPIIHPIMHPINA